ncbi:MAG: hypothetical protein WBB33_04945 [Candidatus Saccharimonadales bacterium]
MTLISVFGPDGVGKSTFCRRFDGAEVISGTNINTWGDTTWAQEFDEKGIDESRVNSSEHFIEKIKRLRTMLGSYPVEKLVVIDSDPFHKTLIHRLMRRGHRDPEQVFDVLLDDTGVVLSDTRHLLIQVSSKISDLEQAEILQERINIRAADCVFDPRTTEESRMMVLAADEAARLIESRNVAVERLYTNEQ